jgi:pimeloyl-ACP methyl ester carboxylesterase
MTCHSSLFTHLQDGIVPTLVTEQGIVHYETFGRGRPVLLLHGWLNSWAVWRTTMEVLGREFKIYALDFFGFGESGDQSEDFSVNNFAALVGSFMDRLGIAKAPLVGHSMGGTVSLLAALRFPERVVKVAVVGSPIEGKSLSPLLRFAAWDGWREIADAVPVLYTPIRAGLRPLLRGYGYIISRDGKTVGKMLADDFAKLSVMSFLESIGTLHDTDLRDRLHEVTMPVMGVYGMEDRIVSPYQYKVLQTYLPSSQIAIFEKSGHFPMNDDPERFHQTMRDFLNQG